MSLSFTPIHLVVAIILAAMIVMIPVHGYPGPIDVFCETDKSSSCPVVRSGHDS